MTQSKKLLSHLEGLLRQDIIRATRQKVREVVKSGAPLNEAMRRIYCDDQAEDAGLNADQVANVGDIVFGSYDGLTVAPDRFVEVVDEVINMVAFP